MSDIFTGTVSVGSTQEVEEAAIQRISGADGGEGEELKTSLMSENPRFCLVCAMASSGPPGSVYIQPCRCGYWVHDQCLINVAMQFEDFHPDTRSIGCRICGRAYNVYPIKNLFLKYTARISNVWYQHFCQIIMEMFIVLAGDVLFVKVGTLVFRMIYGPGEAARLMYSTTPMRGVLTCQLIPVASIVLYNIAWEHPLLELLRKCSRLPVVGGLFPIENVEVLDIYKSSSSSMVLSVVGGLLLPFYAVVTGKLFSGCVEDPFRRFLLGGVTIVLFKGICQIYYKQMKYARLCSLTAEFWADPNG